MNIDVNDAARGPVVFVWNSLTYENADAWTPDTLEIHPTMNVFIIFFSVPIIVLITHNNPTRNRSANIMYVFIENADRNEQTKPSISDVRITFWRPHVSAMKPQKCELTTMPRYETDVNRPCSLVVKCKSHFAYGNINETLIFSRIAPNKLIPVAIVISTWNLPYSKVSYILHPNRFD